MYSKKKIGGRKKKKEKRKEGKKNGKDRYFL